MIYKGDGVNKMNELENNKNKDKYIFDAYTLNGYYARKSQAERLKNELK